MEKVRLDKYISQALGITRQETKKILKSGLVSDGTQVLKDGNEKIDANQITIYYKNEPIDYEEYVYYMLHKPQGVVSATIDNVHKTVIDIIEDSTHSDLFPVGRLDVDTEGLLIITNDGELGHHLTSPRKHVDKTYLAHVTGCLEDNLVDVFAKGLDIGEEQITKPAKLVIVERNKDEDYSIARLTISEGKFHQVKRMFHVCGHEVIYLKRITMGPIPLDESLAIGEYRRLTEEEVNLLKQA